MSSEGSVTVWLNELKAGDDIAAQQLWNRYFARLVAFCRKTLADQPRRASDEGFVVRPPSIPPSKGDGNLNPCR